MQFEPVDFVGENIGIGINGANSFSNANPYANAKYSGKQYRMPINPNFGPTYNYYDDHDYGYSDESVSQQAKDRLSRQNGLNFDDLGRPYPGPQPPTDFNYFTQRDTQQGFSANQPMTDKQRDYAILITSNIHYFVLLIIIVFGVIIGVVNTALLVIQLKKS